MLLGFRSLTISAKKALYSLTISFMLQYLSAENCLIPVFFTSSAFLPPDVYYRNSYVLDQRTYYHIKTSERGEELACLCNVTYTLLNMLLFWKVSRSIASTCQIRKRAITFTPFRMATNSTETIIVEGIVLLEFSSFIYFYIFCNNLLV